MVAGATVLVLITVALIPSAIAPADFAAVDLTHRFEPSTTAFLLGTDQLGRDLLSRIIYGAQTSLLIAFTSTVVGSLFGIALGAVAGYLGRWIDEVVMRFMDVLLAFPSIVLGIAMAALFGPSVLNLAIIIGLLQVPNFARVTRSSVLSVKAQEYIVATRSLGQSDAKILIGHIMPNIIGPLIVLASLTVPGAIVTEAALSFLGLGVQPPTPSWGNLVFDGTRYILGYPWLALYPGLVIIVAVTAFNLLGDGLRDAFDPRSGR